VNAEVASRDTNKESEKKEGKGQKDRECEDRWKDESKPCSSVSGRKGEVIRWCEERLEPHRKSGPSSRDPPLHHLYEQEGKEKAQCRSARDVRRERRQASEENRTPKEDDRRITHPADPTHGSIQNRSPMEEKSVVEDSIPAIEVQYQVAHDTSSRSCFLIRWSETLGIRPNLLHDRERESRLSAWRFAGGCNGERPHSVTVAFHYGRESATGPMSDQTSKYPIRRHSVTQWHPDHLGSDMAQGYSYS